MTRTLLLRPSLCLVVLVALLLPGAYASAGGGIPLIVTVDGGPECTPEGLRGDLVVKLDLCTTVYEDGTSCSDPTTCIPLRVQLISNSKTLALDTRGTDDGTGTGHPRTLKVHFGTCEGPKCASPPRLPAGTVITLDGGGKFVSGDLEVPGLLEVLLHNPFTSITATTPQNGIAKFWFTDISGASWRIDWPEVEVTKVTGGWGIVPLKDPDFLEVAGLSLLTGQRTKPGTIGANGMYDIPFSLHAFPFP